SAQSGPQCQLISPVTPKAGFPRGLLDYYHRGLPYLDGFTGIYADKQAVRVAALRCDRAAIEFRGLPPSVRTSWSKDLVTRSRCRAATGIAAKLSRPTTSASRSTTSEYAGR